MLKRSSTLGWKGIVGFAPALVVTAITLATLPAQAAPIRFVGTLAPEAQGATGTGAVEVWFDDAANTLRVKADFSGLSSATTASHIHCCTAVPFVGNAGVATRVPSFLGFPLGVSSGSFDDVYDTSLSGAFNPAYINNNGGSPASAEAALLAGMLAGRSYFNIHTTAFPGGEIRARLAVPEPASFGLLALGLAGVAAARRRRA